jgi:hypothetical protein
LKSLYKLDGKSYRQKVEAVSRMQRFSFFGKTIINSILCHSAIRNFIGNIIVKVSSDEETFTREKTYVRKLNMVLVQVWYTFVTYQVSLLIIVDILILICIARS